MKSQHSFIAVAILFSLCIGATKSIAQSDGICPDSIHYTLLPGAHHFEFNIANLDDGASVDWNFGDGTLVSDDDTVEYDYQAVNQNVIVSATFTDSDCGGALTLTRSFNLIFSGTTALGSPLDCDDVLSNVNYSSYTASYCLLQTGFSPLNIWAQTFYWDFGDGEGTDYVYGQHVYDSPGTYLVHFTYDSGVCNYFLWEQEYVQDEACGYADSCQVVEYVTTEDCLTFEFSVPGSTYINFGDGVVIGDQHGPWTHTYNTPGTYTVYTQENWPWTCSLEDGLGVMFDLEVGGDCDGDCPFALEPFNPLDGELCVTIELAGANPDLEVSWNMGDGNVIAGGPSIYYCFENPGVYIVTATFVDDDCNTIVGMAPGGSSPPPILSTTITLTVEVTEENPAACYDLTGDDIVNTSDLLIFTSYFGCTSDCNGDFDENGHVNVGDLLIFISAFGIECE